jgi:glycosyltransferase involved in cell wall biosynthesis
MTRHPGEARLRVATIITRLEGGAGALALRGVLGLDPEMFEPLIITGSGGRLLEQAAGHGVEVVVAPVLKPSIAPPADLRALRWLRALLAERRPDVVHTHCAKAGAIGRLAASRAGAARIVHTYHGFPFHEFQSAARRRAYIAAERRLGKLTDVGLCTGTGVAVEAIRRELLPPERVRTIGVTVDRFARPGSAGCPAPHAQRRARARLGLPDGIAVVGAVGRLTYQKAPEDFIAALRMLNRRDVAGVWLGGGELADSVAALAASCGLRIVLAGDRDDVADLLPAFDVFALPSRYEGLPTAVAEAMDCGIPVVATAVNAVADLVEPGVTGLLVPPARPRQLASAIGYLLDNRAEAARMAAAARTRIGPRYSVDALCRALADAYRPGTPGRPAVFDEDEWRACLAAAPIDEGNGSQLRQLHGASDGGLERDDWTTDRRPAGPRHSGSRRG